MLCSVDCWACLLGLDVVFMIAVDDGFIDDLSVGVAVDCCNPAAAVVDLVRDEPRLPPNVCCSSLDDKLE